MRHGQEVDLRTKSSSLNQDMTLVHVVLCWIYHIKAVPDLLTSPASCMWHISTTTHIGLVVSGVAYFSLYCYLAITMI